MLQIIAQLSIDRLASTGFGLESWPCTGSYEPFRRIQGIWQLVYTLHVSGMLYTSVSVLDKLQCQHFIFN